MKRFISVVSLILVICMFSPIVGTAAIEFSDVPTNYTFHDEVLFLTSEGVISGFPDGSFRPEQSVTRAQAAIMIGRALGLDGTPRSTTFKDVDSSRVASGYIASATERGIINGFLNGTFRPDDPVTRGQMAIFLNRAYSLKTGTISSFIDVSLNMAAYQAILNVSATGIAYGYPDGSFRPGQQVTRGQFSAFLARTLDPSFALSPVAQLVNQQLASVRNQKIPGYQFYQAYPVYFTGNEFPEIVVSSYGFEKGSEEFIDKSLLQVYQYHESEGSWKVINSFKNANKDHTYRPLKYITKGKLLDNQKEQLVVGYVWGSDFALTPIVYGSTDGKTVKALINLENKGFLNGDAVIKNKELFFTNHMSLVEDRFVFENGRFIRFTGTGADDHKIAESVDHSLVLGKRNGIPYLSGKRDITMKVGEEFSIIRENKNDSFQNYIFRMYFDSLNGGAMEATDGVLKAVKPGTFKLGILLEGSYGPGIEVKITVI